MKRVGGLQRGTRLLQQNQSWGLDCLELLVCEGFSSAVSSYGCSYFSLEILQVIKDTSFLDQRRSLCIVFSTFLVAREITEFETPEYPILFLWVWECVMKCLRR